MALPARYGMKAEITQLQALLAQRVTEICRLQKSNEALRVHQAALHLLMRTLQEIKEHRIATGGGQDGDGMQQLECMHASLACTTQGSALSAGSSSAAHSNGVANLRGLLDGLPHLAPGESLLHLEG